MSGTVTPFSTVRIATALPIAVRGTALAVRLIVRRFDASRIAAELGGVGVARRRV